MKTLAAALALTASLTAFQARAAVTYDFSGNFQNGNYVPPNASFELTSPTYLSDGDFTAAQSNLACGDSFVTCTGVSLSSTLFPGHEAVSINFTTSSGSQSELYYFSSAAFSSDGSSGQDQGAFGNNATISVSGSPDAVAVSAAPEPSAWALMLGGVGAMGLMLRSRRRQPKLARVTV